MIDLRPYVATLHGRPVAVFGPGGSGKSVTEALLAAGATVVIGDDRSENLVPFQNSPCHLLTPDFSNLIGCAALILGPGVPFTHPKPHAVVQAARTAGTEIIGDIELFHRAYPNQKTVGITGTNGKSTTTALTAHILNACGHKATACGNIGNPICGLSVTPDTILVIEMSSFQIDLCPTFRPTIAVHLNITPDHLDRHGTIENYIAIKERIFEGAGIGFCGIDDPASQAIFDRARNNKARAITPVSVDNQSAFQIDFKALPTLRGRHNQQNALMSAHVARTLGCDDAAIEEALHTYPGLPHRQFLVRRIGQVDYINDSKATNADATEKALMTFNPIHWIVGGQAKAGGLSGLEPYATRIEHAYLIGASTEEFAGFMQANRIPFTRCDTLDRALAAAHHAAQGYNQPATVLLSPACASYDQFKNYEHRGQVFEALVHELQARAA